MGQLGVKRLGQVNRLSAVKQVHSGGDHESGELDLEAYDDLTGAALDPREVKKARATELGYAHRKPVWRRMRRAEAERLGYKIVKTRWIDINKGDLENPLHRSRFVAKEFNDGAIDGLFASTPPLEALRYLISEAATIRKGAKGQKKIIMLNDVSRAFFEAPVKRNLCIELPEEERIEGQDDVGILDYSFLRNS